MPKITAVTIKSDMTPELLRAMREQVKLGLEAIGQEAEGYAKMDCPVDTGRLRNSIAHKVVTTSTENSVYVGSNVEYAVHVEYNEKASHKTGKAHFLRDSLTQHADTYRAILEAALK